MNRNAVSAAIKLVDAPASQEFRSALRAQLLAGFESATSSTDASRLPNLVPPEAAEEYINLEPHPSSVARNKRVWKTLVGVAACIALFATGALIVSRAAHHPNTTNELHDVNPQEALPLARRALISKDALGVRWTNLDSIGANAIPEQAAATLDALADCAVLTSVGIFPPTTKSATAQQYVPGPELMFQDVFVFATAKDASRAMDVIDSEVFPACWFNFFDRLTPLNRSGKTSISEASDAPQIAQHGDRQIIIGQHTKLIRSAQGTQERELINAFIQVGRAIVWINPRVISPGDHFFVDKAITAATSALDNVFGK